MKNIFKKYFHKPEIEFNKPLTSKDIVQMVKDKNFYQLRKLMPQFQWGKKTLSRKKSALVLGGVLAWISLSLLTGHLYPLALVVLSISFGAYAVFYSDSSDNIGGMVSVSELDSTHFVVGFTNGTNYASVVVGSISGTTITFGSAVTVISYANYVYVTVDALDSTHFVVGYYESDLRTHNKIGTVSGTTISLGSSYLAPIRHSNRWLCAIDSTHFVMTGLDTSTSYYGVAVIATVSGSSISYGATSTFNSTASSTSFSRVGLLDSTHFVVLYKDTNNSNYITAKVATFSGTSITGWGTASTFNAGNITSGYKIGALAILDSTHFAVAYADNNNSDEATVRVGSVSGTSITFGSATVFNTSTAGHVATTALDSTHLVLFYYSGQTYIGTVSGTSVSVGPGNYLSRSFQYPAMYSIDSTHFIVAGKCVNTSPYEGEAKFGTYTPTVAPTVTTQAVTNIAQTTATGNGNITDDGGATATRGMCWNTSGTPTTADSHATNGTGEGAYTVSMTGLTAGTHYYVRAYATNSAGTSYGSQVDFYTNFDKSVADSGSGTEITTIKSQIGLTESGQGADESNILGQIGLDESGVGSEVIGALIQLAISDSGIASEAMAILTQLATQDSGVGTEVANVVNQAVANDVGIGSESLVFLMKILLTETASGDDVIGFDKAVVESEGGTGSDTLNILTSMAIADDGVGAEVVSRLNQILETDSGIGTGILEILRKIALSESGVANEALGVLVQTAIKDTALGTDAVSILSNVIAEDSGAGSEVLSILAKIPISDSGVGTEALGLVVSLALQDTATGSEAINVLVNMAISDMGTAVDTLVIIGKYLISDSGIASDVAKILAQLIVADTGVGNEVVSFVRQLQEIDSGLGNDLVTEILAQIKINETGEGLDRLKVPLTYYDEYKKQNTDYKNTYF